MIGSQEAPRSVKPIFWMLSPRSDAFGSVRGVSVIIYEYDPPPDFWRVRASACWCGESALPPLRGYREPVQVSWAGPEGPRDLTCRRSSGYAIARSRIWVGDDAGLYSLFRI